MSAKSANLPNVVRLNTHKKEATAKACPICAKPQMGEYSPFCSRRCANSDLGNWLDGKYAISTDEASDFDDNDED